MKQQGRRAARAKCVMQKRLKLLEKAYLLCIILSWLGWSKVKRAIKFWHLPFWSWFFSTATHLLTVFLAWLYIIFGGIK